MTADIRVSVRRSIYQGLPVYRPVLTVFENGKRLYSFTPEGDALVSRESAKKYGQLHRRDMLAVSR